jgi:hypothetical protein
MRWSSLLNRAKRNPLVVLLVALIAAAAVAVGVYFSVRLFKKRERFDDSKCRMDGGRALTCPQSGLREAGFNCLHYDGARCCRNNWFGNNKGEGGYCKAMNMKNITEDWNIPRFFSKDDLGGDAITSRGVYGGTSITGGWKNLPGMWQDNISSVKVPGGYKVELSQKDDGEGKILTLNTGSYNLKNCAFEDGTCGSDDVCGSSNTFCWRNTANAIRVTAV